MNGIFLWVLILLIPIALVLGAVIGYLVKQSQVEKIQQTQRDEANRILEETKEKVREMEIQARDQALEILQKAETENNRRRNELSREEDRLQKRREELDNRIDRLERREQNINRRQSALDKRANEVEKLHADEMEELQRISQMTIDEARGILLAEVEKLTIPMRTTGSLAADLASEILIATTHNMVVIKTINQLFILVLIRLLLWHQ